MSLKGCSTTPQYLSGNHLEPKKDGGGEPIAGTGRRSAVTDAGRETITPKTKRHHWDRERTNDSKPKGDRSKVCSRISQKIRIVKYAG